MTDDIDPRIAEYLFENNDGDESLVLTQAVVVAEYLDADGDSCWSASTLGNGNISGYVGLLEFAKDWLIERMKEWS